jgi:putative membrane protein insertion efficiency factor
MTHSKTMGEFAVDGRADLPVGRGRAAARPYRIGSWFQYVISFLIQVYRWTLSPALVFLFGANSGCRFTPTCSQYAREAIQQHGAMTGSLLTLKRVCRCNPFGPCGHDPVPGKSLNRLRHEPRTSSTKIRKWRLTADETRASRGSANGGCYNKPVYPGRRSQTRLPWATICHPYGVLMQRLRRIRGEKVSHG